MSGHGEIDVAYVAALARLELTDEEQERFGAQLAGILDYIATLKEIDVEGIEPTAHPAPVLDRMREDVARDGLEREDVLQNAPDSARDQIRVPKVVDA